MKCTTVVDDHPRHHHTHHRDHHHDHNHHPNHGVHHHHHHQHDHHLIKRVNRGHLVTLNMNKGWEGAARGGGQASLIIIIMIVLMSMMMMTLNILTSMLMIILMIRMMMMLVDTDQLWRWRRKSKSQWSSWFSWWWWLMTMTTRKVQFGYLRWILTTLTHLAWLHCVGANTALCYTQIDSPTGQHVWHREPVRAHLFTSDVVHAKQQEINLRNKLQHTMLNLVNITNTLFPFIVTNFEKKMTSKKYFCSVPIRVGIIRLLIALSCIPFQPEAQPDTYLAIQRRIDQASPKAHCRLQLKRNGRLVWWSTLPRAYYNLCPVPS